MRHIFYVFTIVFSIAFFTACEIDTCDDLICLNDGTPQIDGNDCRCLCKKGFSGSDCSIEDKCESQGTTCRNNGDCIDGVCICRGGYEGDSCQTESRIKFVGTYLADDTCVGLTGVNTYQVSMLDSTITPTYLFIQGGFADSTFIADVIANADGSSLIIKSQAPDGNLLYVSGSGILSGSNIIWEYTLTDSSSIPPVVTSCSGLWQKQ